eukprot:457492_1
MGKRGLRSLNDHDEKSNTSRRPFKKRKLPPQLRPFPVQSQKMTKDQFMSQPLAAFINDNDEETNFDIAKSIVTFFEDRDDGTYAAIVSDKQITSTFWCIEGKTRYVEKCRGKNIQLWKQAKSVPLMKDVKDDTIQTVVKCFIKEHDNLSKVKNDVEEIFGQAWAVVVSRGVAGVYASYSKYFVSMTFNNSQWFVWRQLRQVI